MLVVPLELCAAPHTAWGMLYQLRIHACRMLIGPFMDGPCADESCMSDAARGLRFDGLSGSHFLKKTLFSPRISDISWGRDSNVLLTGSYDKCVPQNSARFTPVATLFQPH